MAFSRGRGRNWEVCLKLCLLLLGICHTLRSSSRTEGWLKSWVLSGWKEHSIVIDCQRGAAIIKRIGYYHERTPDVCWELAVRQLCISWKFEDIVLVVFAPRYLCPFTPSPHLFLATITKTKSTLTTITITIIIIIISWPPRTSWAAAWLSSSSLPAMHWYMPPSSLPTSLVMMMVVVPVVRMVDHSSSPAWPDDKCGGAGSDPLTWQDQLPISKPVSIKDKYFTTVYHG